MKRKLSFVLLSVLLVMLVSGGIVLGKDLTIRLAYNSLPFNLPSLVEHQMGFIAQEGFKVEYNSFMVGHTMTEAMATGDLEIAPVMGSTSTIVSKAGGRDIKVIEVYSQAPAAFALVTIPNTLKLSELRGKKIAVPIGTEVHVLLGKILAEQGLTFADVELVNLLVPDGITALQSRQVAAAMVVEPVMTKLNMAGQIEVLRDGEGLIAGITLSVVPSKLLASDKVEAFKKAQQRSIEYINNNLDQALVLAAKELNFPMAIGETIAQKYTFGPEFTAEMREEIDETIQFLYDQNLIKKRISVDDLF